MKKAILITTALTLSLSAMTMQEAVSKALNSYDGLKATEYSTKAQKNSFEATRNAKLMPHLKATYGYTMSDNKKFDKPTMDNSDKVNNFDLNASINLFNGFRDHYDIQSSELNYKAAEEKLTSVREDVKFKTKQAYIAVLKAKGDVKIAENSLSLTSKQLEDARSYFKQGIIPKNELLHTEVQYAMKKQSLSQKKSDLKIAILNLGNIINEKIADAETFYFDEYKAVNVDENYLSTLIDNKSDIKNYKLQAESARAKMKSAKANLYMPRVDLSADYIKTGEGVSLKPITSSSRPKNEKKVQLLFTWNLFDGMADMKGEVASRAMYDSATMNLNKVKKDTMLQLDSAIENYKLAINNLSVMQKAESQAEENYRIVEHRYAEHIDNTTNLLDAELLLSTAKNNLNQTKYAVFLALAEIERIVELDF